MIGWRLQNATKLPEVAEVLSAKIDATLFIGWSSAGVGTVDVSDEGKNGQQARVRRPRTSPRESGDEEHEINACMCLMVGSSHCFFTGGSKISFRISTTCFVRHKPSRADGDVDSGHLELVIIISPPLQIIFVDKDQKEMIHHHDADAAYRSVITIAMTYDVFLVIIRTGLKTPANTSWKGQRTPAEGYPYHCPWLHHASRLVMYQIVPPSIGKLPDMRTLYGYS
ncbi:hypothetical protein BDY19DRAFT_908492 [Irpex rosettiformis]|uniref:Uncharacterized protein n=1 Tax=Irpex rosettiformis TaxID=378272 RepID=A0ACB8TVZ4_9APHY|nr:hypothetical protein BDY19DRAFT_908492 [Irpex rosettiformis]